VLVCVDWASVDGNKPPDWNSFGAACTANGGRAAMAIIRGCWGTQRDLTLARDLEKAWDAGLVVGAYLYLRMPNAGFFAPPETQVDAFAMSYGTPPPRPRSLVPTLDVEDTGLWNQGHGPAARQELEWVTRAWSRMRDIYGAPPMIYTSDRVWTEDLHRLPSVEMSQSPLWVAKPWPIDVRRPAQLSDALFKDGRNDPVVPGPWGDRNWWLHQYQGDALPTPGFSKTVDLSRFRVMRVGEVGARVAWVRDRLALPNVGTPPVAVFDADMLRAVRTFQADKRLEVDGIIGPQTFAALSWSGWKPTVLAA
jgi:hypothetical protein